MKKNVALIIYALLMVAVVVIADLLFFRHRFWERLIANVSIVLVFIIFYLLSLKRT